MKHWLRRDPPSGPTPPTPGPRTPGPLTPLPFAALLGAVVALSCLAVFLPVPDGWSGDFGSAHWMTRVFAAATVAALAAGLGSRDGSVAAGLTATLGAVFGLGEYLSDEPSGRAPAPLAACLCCTAAALLCVPLIRRTRPWLTVRDRALRRRVRRLGALLLVGACLGGLFGSGALLFAYDLRTEYGPKPPRTESATVPDGERDAGAADDRAELPKALKAAWHREFRSPVGLSVCGNGKREEGERFRGTLVALEPARPGAAVVGLDAATGGERWRFTVRDPEGVAQVAVSEGCAVMVIHGRWLTAIDSYDGSVRGRSALPGLGLFERLPDRWRFLTAAAYGDDPPPVVPVPRAELAYVSSQESGVLAVDRTDASIVGRARSRGAYCRYLVDHSSPHDEGSLLIANCAEGQLGLVDLPDLPTSDPSGPPLLFGSRPELTIPPPPGCEYLDRATAVDFTHRRVVAVADACGKGRTWVGEIGLAYGRDLPVHWTSVPGESGGYPGVMTGLAGVHLVPAPDGIWLIGGDGRKERALYRLGQGESAAALVEVEPRFATEAESYFLVLTDSGRLHLLRHERAQAPTGTRLVGQGDFAAPRTPCSRGGTLLYDRSSGTVLVVCTGPTPSVRTLRP
ncbi:hypothetical protein [Streptomyces sp. N35]|uniref:hypothetical protein n=1 Tax=Streptomyces sp. N35 TaxID=2795730 RepID=UPI0018F62C20|nr:hypothetical protein [Streptomyces sp. N35]